MPTYNMHEAKTHFSKLARAALEGENIIIAKAGVPILRLEKVEAKAPKKRVLGTLSHLRSKMPTDEEWKRMDQGIEREIYDGLERKLGHWVK